MDEIVNAWKEYLDSLEDWQAVVADVTAKQTQCGPVYEPESPFPDRGETFAISDMRGVRVAYPHYHKNGETEIYFVIQGTGLTVVGGEEKRLEKGTIIVTPQNITHFTIPENDLVMMVINTPKFDAENIVEPIESDPAVKFDKEQYEQLVHKYAG